MGQGQVSFSNHTLSLGGDGSVSANGKVGCLKAKGGDYDVSVLTMEAVSETISEMLQEINQPQMNELSPDTAFIHITPELVEVEIEIALLLQELEEPPPLPSQAKTQSEAKSTPQPLSSTPRSSQKSESQTSSSRQEGKEVYSSLFSLARSLNSAFSKSQQKNGGEAQQRPQESGKGKESSLLTSLQASTSPETPKGEQSHYDREGNQNKKEDQGQQGEDSSSRNPEDEQKKSSKNGEGKKKVSVQSIQAERPPQQYEANQAPRRSQRPSANTEGVGAKRGANSGTPSVDSIYLRFIALMARILGQAEHEAHELYIRIKERTDAIDVLTLLVSKVNSEKAAIDWSKDEEMKKLLERARSLGVDIPEGKYTWSEEEKKLLKENVQMRKDSMEKLTQLERTDMQRYLQESSQCHQARSNILKLLKEVVDTIVHNLRPS